MSKEINKGGRPKKFESVHQLEELIDQYFEKIESEKDFPEWTELLCHLDCSKDTLCEYAKKDGFSDPIRKAKQKCEAAIAKGMLKGKMNATGAIFTLKNNYGWEDRYEHGVKQEKIIKGLTREKAAEILADE